MIKIKDYSVDERKDNHGFTNFDDFSYKYLIQIYNSQFFGNIILIGINNINNTEGWRRLFKSI